MIYSENWEEVRETKMAERMNAGILTVGNEVLEGIVLDTNSHWLESRLRIMGVEIIRHATVRDDKSEIAQGLDFLLSCCNLVITTGGLGPTHDDKTLEAIADYFDVNTQEDAAAAEIVKRQYRELYEKGIVDSPEYTEKRAKMARIPEGSSPLDNRVGGAPGVFVKRESISLFALPGVPSEMKFIFEDSVSPWIREHLGGQLMEQVVEFPIKDETVFAPFIDAVMDTHPHIYIKSMPKTYGSSDVLRVWISARGEDKNQLARRIDEAIAELEDVSGLHAEPESEH